MGYNKKHMRYHASPIQTVTETLKTTIDNGLSADEVQCRQQQYGRNELAHAKPRSIVFKFFAQFKDTMIVILLVAAAVSLAADRPPHRPPGR